MRPASLVRSGSRAVSSDNTMNGESPTAASSRATRTAASLPAA
jgi:hypothetical protein